MTTERAQKIWNTYIEGYAEALMTPVEDFSTYLDDDSRKIIASVLREVINQLQYDNSDWDAPDEHMVIDVKDILKLTEELEAL